jgi:hypothetical protein
VGPPIFNGYAGVVAANGQGSGKLVVPNVTALVGLCVYHAGIAFNAKGISCCTNTEGTALVP